MRLYITVAALTFFGCFAAYSASHMLGAASAIGGRTSSSTTSFLYNPLTLLNPSRLRDMVASNAGTSGMPAFRPRFETSTWRWSRGWAVNRQFYAPPVRFTPQVRFHR